MAFQPMFTAAWTPSARASPEVMSVALLQSIMRKMRFHSPIIKLLLRGTYMSLAPEVQPFVVMQTCWPCSIPATFDMGRYLTERTWSIITRVVGVPALWRTERPNLFYHVRVSNYFAHRDREARNTDPQIVQSCGCQRRPVMFTKQNNSRWVSVGSRHTEFRSLILCLGTTATATCE